MIRTILTLDMYVITGKCIMYGMSEHLWSGDSVLFYCINPYLWFVFRKFGLVPI
jgi:hypothetical protein